MQIVESEVDSQQEKGREKGACKPARVLNWSLAKMLELADDNDDGED